MTFRVEIDDTLKDLTQANDGIRAAVQLGLRLLAAQAAAQAKQTTAFKDRSGDLRKSIRAGRKSLYATWVKAGGEDAPYARFIESGSKPHAIVARNASMLRFEQDGQIVFRRRVYHPGTKPARFMAAARDGAEAIAHNYFEPGINSVLR